MATPSYKERMKAARAAASAERKAQQAEWHRRLELSCEVRRLALNATKAAIQVPGCFTRSTDMSKRREGDAKGTGESRRNFLKTTTLVGGAAALGTVTSSFTSRAQAQELTPRQVPLAGMATMPGKANHWYVPASDKTQAGKRDFWGGDKEVKTASKGSGHRGRDNVSLINPAN